MPFRLWDVFYICQDDWANSAYRYSNCLKRLGLKVMAIKINPHPFFYPETLPTYQNLQAAEVQGFVDKSSVIVLHNSTVLEGINFHGKPVVAQHGGNLYRQWHDKLNSFLNPITAATILQCPDLLGLGAKNEHWISFPVDTDYINPTGMEGHEGKLIFGHFPSNPTAKGTKTICGVVDKFSDRFKYIGSRSDNAMKNVFTWDENLSRLADCDVYIECLHPTHAGNKFGEFGNQALEAAAMGKIVITNSLAKDLYEKEYGRNELIIANTPEELEASIESVLQMSSAQVLEKKKAMRDWVVENHSFEAIGKRLWEKVYKGFF